MARNAGVSTKTLYRLVPNKAALFEGMVSDRLDRFLSDFELQVPEDADIEAGLNAALMAYAELGLDPDVVGLNVIVKFALWPAGMVCGSEKLPMVNTELFGLAAVTATVRDAEPVPPPIGVAADASGVGLPEYSW